MEAREALAAGIESCKVLTGRFLAGFGDANRTSQAPGLPNHAAWTLGHLALSFNAVANDLDGRGAPGAGFSREEPGFDPAGVAFDSVPDGDATRYPDFARCLEIFDAACDRLGAAVRGASDAELQRIVKFGPFDVTKMWTITFMIFHAGFHTGQLADLRRGLGMGRVLGDVARVGGPRPG